MRTQKLLAAVAIAAGLLGTARAVDAPHDASFTSGSCDSCHKLHSSAPGGTLGYYANNDACVTCHNASPGANNQLGLPWNQITDQATPGTTGLHHRWDATAIAPAYGAAMPANPEMTERILAGTIQCATCHDPHRDDPSFAPNSVHTSLAIGVDTLKSGGTGSGTLKLSSVAAGARGQGYRVEVTAVAGTTGSFVISHDAGTGSPTVAYGPVPYTIGTPINLDDPAVLVVFGGTPAVGDYWDFYVGYPRLRQTNVADAMCLQCHAERDQSHTVVGAESKLPATVMSHPVGGTLGVNGGGYDLTPATMLDATGATQTVGDGNRTNDLVLDGGTTVRCTTCHAPHNADSNSLTEDLR